MGHGPGGAPAVLELTSVVATVTVEELAEIFAGLGDEAQAEFFTHMARAFAKFGRHDPATQLETGRRGTGMGGHTKAMSIGEYLGRTSPDAVELLRTVVESAEGEIVKGVMES